MRRRNLATAISLAVGLAIAVTASPMASYAAPGAPLISGNYRYAIVDETASILGYLGSDTVVAIPDQIDGYVVTGIDTEAFRNVGLRSVTIPDTVTSIGSRAFLGNALTAVVIPDSVTWLGAYAFAENNLSEVVLSAGNTELGVGAFSQNSLAAISIPNTVTSIAPNAFSDNLLSHLSIPNSVTSIGSGAFRNNQLSYITVPGSVSELGSSAFQNNRLYSVSISGSVREIGGFAFSDNLLSSVTIPSSVNEIGEGAFSNNFIEELVLPSSVQRVGAWAFSSNALETVDLGSVQVIGNGAFESNFLTSVELPSSLRTIGDTAFAQNALSSASIPNSVTTIGQGAFASNLLTDLTLPGTLTEISNGAFSDNLLTEVELPAGVTTVGDSAFQGNQLEELDLPDNLVSIGNGAFAGNRLASVAIPDHVQTIGHAAFTANRLLSVTIGDSVQVIGIAAFAGNALASIAIPASVDWVDSQAFAGNSLTNIRMGGDEPRTIGGAIFGDSDPLVTFPFNGRYTPGSPGYWNAGGTEYRVTGGTPPPGLGYDGQPVTDYEAWFDSWREETPYWPGGTPKPVGFKYFALGDSYQSGEGAYAYYGDTAIPSNFCHRAPTAYPQLLSDSGVFEELSLNFWACSGATIVTALHADEVSGDSPPWNDPNRTSWLLSSNIERNISVLDRLDEDVAVITIGIGGNDVGFESILTDCILGSTKDMLAYHALPFSCESSLGIDTDTQIASFARKQLRLVGSANDLQWNLELLHRAAPNAQIYVFGYPRFFPESSVFYCETIRPSDQRWINAEIASLNKIIKASAESRGAQYIDIYNVGDSVEVCSGAEESDWFMNGLNIGWESVDFDSRMANPESFHPTIIGHALIADAFEDQAKSPVSGWFGSISQGSTQTSSFTVASTSLLSTSVRYRGSDIPITLISPSGEIYDRSSNQDALSADRGSNWEYLEIANPEPGTWTVELYGAEVDGIGEPFHFQWSAAEPPNMAPVALATLSRDGRTVTVEAASSYDVDGSLAEIGIDFGDGHVAFGESATYTYPSNVYGDVLVTMWVKDNRGEYAFAEVGTTFYIEPIQVNAGDAEPGRTVTGSPSASGSTLDEPVTQETPINEQASPSAVAVPDSPVASGDQSTGDPTTPVEGGSGLNVALVLSVVALGIAAGLVVFAVSRRRRG